MRVTDRPVYVHGMMLGMIEVYRDAGVAMLPVLPVIERARGARSSAASFAGELVLAPLSARGTPWMRRLGDISDAFASGLMRVRGVRRQRGVRSRLRALRSRRLAGAAADHRRDRRGARARHPRPRRAARALSAASAGSRRASCRTAWEGEAGRRLMRMKRFAALYDAIDRTTSTNAKVAAMVAVLRRRRRRADAAWAVFFLTGRRLKRLVPSAAIRDWTLAATGLDDWLLDECYAVVGDGAETAALVLDQLPVASRRRRCRSPRGCEDAHPAAARTRSGRRSRRASAAGGARSIGCSASCCSSCSPASCASASRRRWSSARWRRPRGCRRPTIAARLMGEWTPSADWFAALLSHEHTDDDRSRPYPFFLASPLEEPVEALGAVATTGWSSGSGTASARSWSAAAAPSISGRAAKS